MQCKKAYLVANFLLLIATALCLQGCSHTSTSIGRALVIGIPLNQANDNLLPNAPVDAKDFADALSKSTNIAPGHLRLITGNQTQQTRENLLKELRQFAQRTNKSDVAWLMIEGHGAKINGENYFYTEDTKQKDGKPVKATMVSIPEIMQALANMQAKDLIVTIAQNPDPLRNPTMFPNRFYLPLSETQWPTNWKLPLHVNNVVVFNFSGLEHNDSNQPLTNAFTYRLIKGLEGGAADQNGQVKLRSLIQYVQLGVASEIRFFGEYIANCDWSVVSEDKSKILNTVLAKNLPPSFGGKTAVSLPPHPSAMDKSNAAVFRAFELSIEIQQDIKNKGGTSYTEKPNTSLQFRRRKFAPVKNQLIKALRFDPNAPKANYELGLLERYLCEFKDAQTHLEKAMNIAPTEPVCPYDLAILMQDERKYKEAEKLYKRALKLAPNDVSIRYRLSTLYIATHQNNAAKQLLKKIIQDDPTWDAPLNQLSYIVAVSGDQPKAIALLQRAHKLNPKNTDVLYRLAWSYCHVSKDYKMSEQLYRDLVKLSPGKALYRKEFAKCLLLQGKTDEAKIQANKALDLGYSPDDPLFKKLDLR